MTAASGVQIIGIASGESDAGIAHRLDNVRIDATLEKAYGSASTVKCAVAESSPAIARAERTPE
jgi:hypothetical protein